MDSENWMKHVTSIAKEAGEVPMWGSIPSFPWKEFSEALAQSLGIDKLKVAGGGAEWKDESSILSGMGHTPLQVGLEMSPLKGSFSLVFPSEDFSKLSSWAIHPTAGQEGFSDPYLQKGFFRYLTAQGLAIVDQLRTFQGLTPKTVDSPLVKEEAYCIDIAVSHKKETARGRLICPPSFQKALKTHFAQDWSFSIPSHLYDTLSLELALSAGRVQLSQQELKKLEAGDFVLLDQCSYYPKLKKGTFQLSLNQTPLFQTKIKEEMIKLLDYAHTFEEQPMDMDDETFDGGFDEPVEEEVVSVEEPPEAPAISPKKVPIALTVEVARLKMDLNKLLRLKPGNILELGVQPEKGVSLVANGKCIGKGELLQVGDVIGVKITQLGE